MQKTQLFCIPYAGGSSSFYNILLPKLNDVYDIVPIELSGHGMRIDESLLPEMSSIVIDVYKQIKRKKRNVPFVLLGYSMGTDICYELAHYMAIQDGVLPSGLFLFANTPPHDVDVNCFDESWTEKEFIDVLIGYGGLTREILENDEFKELFLPILRNDFMAERNYIMSEYEMKLPCDSVIFYCDADNESGKMMEWSQYFTGTCRYYKMSGNHFFIKDNLNSISNIIRNTRFRQI